MNLLNLVQNQLSTQTIEQISKATGESLENTRSAMSNAFPALLGSLVAKGNASPDGASEIFQMLADGQRRGGWSESIPVDMFAQTGGATQTSSQSVLASLLGSRLAPVAEIIARRCGIRASSAASLLRMAAPVLMGILSKEVSSQNMGATGLGRLLASQTQYLKDALPSELANALGIGDLLWEAGEKAGAQALPAHARSAEPAPLETGSSRAVHKHEVPHGAGLLKWAWVPLSVLLALWFVGNRNRTANKGAPPESTATVRGGGSRSPDLSSLRLIPGGTADQMARAISAADSSRTFWLRGLRFDSSGGMSESDRTRIQEIASVLSHAPDARILITSYGETEDAALNQAAIIKNMLASARVAEDRIATRGQVGRGDPAITLVHDQGQ